MRLWHYKLLEYLPDAQFKGQFREMIAIVRDWKEKGKTNHLLINRVMDYPRNDFVRYYLLYDNANHKRYGKWLHHEWLNLFLHFSNVEGERSNGLFEGWHNKDYLRVCMANLYEKYMFGKGKSKITEEEWQCLLNGYKEITGEDYKV